MALSGTLLKSRKSKQKKKKTPRISTSYDENSIQFPDEAHKKWAPSPIGVADLGYDWEESHRPDSLPSLQNFVINSVIGKGKFAKVYHASVSDGGTLKGLSDFSIKVVEKEIPDSSESNFYTQRYILREKNVLASLIHPRISALYFAFQTGRYAFFVNEYHSGGSLRHHLKVAKVSPEKKKYVRNVNESKFAFTEEAVCFYGQQITDAVIFMHTNGIIHRDIKPENILLDNLGKIKIIDFGLAKSFLSASQTTCTGAPHNKLFTNVYNEHHAQTVCGTESYMAPEIIQHKSYGAQVDWWAVGVTLFELVTNERPYKTEKDMTPGQLMMQFELMESQYTVELKNLIVDLLHPVIAKRLGSTPTSASSILEHPFLLQKVETPFRPSSKKFRNIDSRVLDVPSKASFEDNDCTSENYRAAFIENFDYVMHQTEFSEDELQDEEIKPATKKLSNASFFFCAGPSCFA